MTTALDALTVSTVGVQHEFPQAVAAAQQSDSKLQPWKAKARHRRDFGGLQASFDSASVNKENYRHWLYSDYLSADASMRSEVRRRIRSRARYELQENNSIGKGLVLTLANDCIGTGPRLRMHLGVDRYNLRIQRAFTKWAKKIKLAAKLRTLKIAKTVDGEGVARIITNTRLTSPVQTDLKIIEADQLTSPYAMLDSSPEYVDGVHLDGNGNPTRYDILKYHPGSQHNRTNVLEYDTYDADSVIHWFRCDRPGQHRGISEVASALPLFAYLRRFTLAVIAAAETAANNAVVINTNAALPEEFEDEVNQTMYDLMMETVQLDRNGMLVLPNEWQASAFQASQPATTYEMFKREIINEMSRCLSMPLNVATGNSSNHNYASGRLDHQVYHRSIRVEQAEIGEVILDRLLSEWLYEAALVGGVIPGRVSEKIRRIADTWGVHAIADEIPHKWHFDGFEHSDPMKEASAQAEKLQNGTTNRALEYDRLGLNMDEEDARAAEAYNMTVQQYRQACAVAMFSNGNFIGGLQFIGQNENQTTGTPDGGGNAPVNQSRRAQNRQAALNDPEE